MAETRTFSNPIVPGFAPDPSVVFVHGVFYLATSSFHVFPGIPIYASTDLQEWKHISNAINRKEQLSLARASTAVMPLDTGNVMVASAGLFAPTIRYHEGIFYIVCTNAIRGDGGRLSLDNFYVSTDDIWSGSWSDPIHFPFAGIDPSIFFDNDGKTYIQGCWMVDRLRQPSCTIKQLEIDIGTGEVLQEAREIWGGFARYDTEGPHVYKRDGWYYLLVAEGGTFEHHLLSIGRSRSIWGPYESCPANPIMTADRKPEEYIQNIGHGELFQGHNGTWWAAVLGVRSEEGGPPLGRETFLTGVDWPEGGWPVVQQPRMEFSRSLPGPVGGGEMKASPDGVGYVYIRDHDPERYDFRGKGEDKFYTLRPSAAGLSAQSITATFVGKRQRSLDASASVTLDLTGGPHSKPVKAGLALYKDGLRHVSLAYDFAAAQLVYDVTTTSKEKCQTASIPLDSRPKAISFRVSTSAKEYRFSYRVADTKEWVEAGSAQVADLVAREMTGPIFGIFAHTNDSETTGQQVTFTKFTLEGQKNLIW